MYQVYWGRGQRGGGKGKVRALFTNSSQAEKAESYRKEIQCLLSRSVRNSLFPTPGIAKRPLRPSKIREQLPHTRCHQHLSKSLKPAPLPPGNRAVRGFRLFSFRVFENQKTDQSFPERYTALPSYSMLESRELSVALKQGPS